MTTPETTPHPHAQAWPDVVDEMLDLDGRPVRVLRSRDLRLQRGEEPQLLVHGLGGSAATWVGVVAGLRRHGPVVAVDLPGFGRTEAQPGEPLTVEHYVEFVLALADRLGWSRFALHGNSMGGLISVLLAADHGDRVSRLVLVSPALAPDCPLRLTVPNRAMLEGLVPIGVSSASAAAIGLLGLAAPALDERRNRALLRLIYSDPDGVDRDLLDFIAADHVVPEPDPDAVLGDALAGPDVTERRRALLSALVSIARHWVFPRRMWRAISAVSAPTMVVGGTADAIVPAYVLRGVLARRRDWEGHVLDDRRHALMMEDPEAYLDLVAAWRAAAAAA